MFHKGFTFIELLLAAALSLLVLGSFVLLAGAQRRLFERDEQRVSANQNARAALDLLNADLRQAGERLPINFPALEVRQQGTELIIRRNLLDIALAVCDRNGINGNQDNIPVADRNPPRNPDPAYLEACTYKDLDNNGFDDRIDAWRAYRCSMDGNPGCNRNPNEIARAYIYDPVRRVGEWFDYDAEDSSGFKIHKGNTQHWQYSYGPLARLYVLEERRYYLQNSLLNMQENGRTVWPLVADIRSFTARVQSRGVWRTEFPAANENWTEAETVEVSVVSQRGPTRRTLTTQATPRNIFSR